MIIKKPERNAEIRAKYESGGYTLRSLADAYDLSVTRIAHIVDPSKIEKVKGYRRKSKRTTTPELENATRADLLRRLLEDVGISQFKLADIFEMSRITINKWAIGHTFVPTYAI